MSETRYEVRDLAGTLVATQVRRDRFIGGETIKSYSWLRPGCQDEGLHGLHAYDLPLFGTERIPGWAADEAVVLTEGEKSAAALHARGLAAVGTVTGKPTIPRAEPLAVLMGRHVILWPDNDPDGTARDFMVRIARRLAGVAASVRLFTWPDAPPKGDAADWTASTDELRAVLAAAPLVTDQAAPKAGTATGSADAGPDIARLIAHGAADGSRRAGALSIAGYYRHRDEPQAHAAAVVLAYAIKCQPPFDETEARAVVADVYTRYQAGERAALTPTDADAGRHAVLTKLSEIAPERVSWLWPGRIPLGKVAVLDGHPGLGKSTVTLDLAARVSRGHAMPDGSWSALTGPAGVVLLSAEDGAGDTIRPRLEAAGADCDRIALLTMTDEHGAAMFTLPDDLPLLHQAVGHIGAKLVIVDPLMSYLATSTNTYKDQDVRRALAPLAQLADETGVVVLIIRHFTKGTSSDPLMRGGGSIGIIGAARAGLLVGAHPDDGDDPNGRRVLAVYKSNLAIKPPALVYRLHDAGTGVARVEWEPEPLTISAADLLGASAGDEPRGARKEAEAFLQEMLADEPEPARFIYDEAKAARISAATLRRAKDALGVTVAKGGYQGAWLWSLVKDAQYGQRRASSESEHLWEDVSAFGPADGTPFDVMRCRRCDRPAEHLNPTGPHCRDHAMHEPGALMTPLAPAAD